MDLILANPGKFHPSLDTVWEFEKTILSDGRVTGRSFKFNPFSEIPNLFWRILQRALVFAGRGKSSSNASRVQHNPGRRDMFVILMGPNIRKAMPWFLFSGRKSAYLFDSWPDRQEKARLFAKSCDLEYLFVSSSQAADSLSQKLPDTKCRWIPEGIDPEPYSFFSLSDKKIDVLQLGRRYESYHNLIVEPLARLQKTYLFEKQSGQIIFPTRDNFLDGLARSKVSICVPLSMSHPQRAGGIETMTIRYLQSMLSKCLILGHAPRETVELFGYNPVVEIDFNDPVGQLLSILDHIENYTELIEKNYRSALTSQTWKNRWEQIAYTLWSDRQLN